MLNVELIVLNVELIVLNVDFVGRKPFLNHDAKKVQTRTELSLLKLCRVQPFFERQCKDTPISRYHQISACDKARFSARFQSETC